MQTFGPLIDGTMHTGDGACMKIYTPGTDEHYANVYLTNVSLARQAIDSAADAFPAWSATPAGKREEILRTAASLVEKRREELVELSIDEAGSTLAKARFEVNKFAEDLRVTAGEARRVFGETYPGNEPGRHSFSVRRPMGVVAGIAPFNFPYVLGGKKAAFALAAGNCFILKPSEVTPVSGLKIGEILHEAGVAKEVVQVLPATADSMGDILFEDPRIRMIAFTGSTRVGKIIASKAAAHLKHCTLELGGNSPVVVLNDADVDYAAHATAFGVFIHQGQICMAGARMVVENGVYDDFCSALVARAEGLQVGDVRDPNTIIGPLIRPQQCDFIAGQVKDAVAKGARVLTGGTFSGSTMAPTVVADVTPEMDIFYEESFGPVAIVCRAEDTDHALKLANDNVYGLASAVFTQDLALAQIFWNGIEAGMVHINAPTIADDGIAPFGGVKNSGLGRENGRHSIEAMTELKWVTLSHQKVSMPF